MKITVLGGNRQHTYAHSRNFAFIAGIHTPWSNAYACQLICVYEIVLLYLHESRKENHENFSY